MVRLVKEMTRRQALITSVMGFMSLSSCALSEGPTDDNYKMTAVFPQRKWTLPEKQVEHQSIFARSQNAKLWCLDSGGEGVPVVFVHPFSGSAEVWPYQQDYLVEKGYRVVTYSRRGHLGSSDEGYGEDENATKDLLAVVNHLGLKTFHLVGMAAGADILPDFAASFPDRLLSLTIGCTIGKPGDPKYTAQKKLLLPNAFKQLPTWLKELSPSYRSGFPEGVMAWQELRKRSLLKRHPMKLNKAVTPERIATIKTPVLLFTGDADLYMPPFRLVEYAKYWINPEVKVFSEAGHAPQWEQPEAFNKTLVEFISKFNDK